MRNKFVIISGPSGVGKTTLIKEMLKQEPMLTRIVSYTTRAQREDEQDGVDYFFISKEEFFKKREAGDFLEWTAVFNHYSATCKRQIEEVWKQGKVIIKDVDVKGLKTIKELYPQSLVVGVFIKDIKELRRRLEGRESLESSSDFKTRLSGHEKTLDELKKLCSVQIYNDSLNEAVDSLKKEIEKYLSSS